MLIADSYKPICRSLVTRKKILCTLILKLITEMKKHLLISLIALSVIMILSSCISRKKLTYLQYSDKSTFYDGSTDGASVTPAAYKIMTYDNLYIRVLTPDPQWSALFNLESGAGGMTQESAALSGYTVDNEGNIEIPYVGKVTVAGKTITELKLDLESVFKNYVTDAAITVKLVNNYISILGEVNAPGRYNLTKDCINIFEALAMASDMNQYSNRQRVQLIRPSPYGPVVKEFSLRDRSVLSSEFYYVMPNDIIYAMPMKGKADQLSTGFYTLILSTISTALVIISYFRTL